MAAPRHIEFPNQPPASEPAPIPYSERLEKTLERRRKQREQLKQQQQQADLEALRNTAAENKILAQSTNDNTAAEIEELAADMYNEIVEPESTATSRAFSELHQLEQARLEEKPKAKTIKPGSLQERIANTKKRPAYEEDINEILAAGLEPIKDTLAELTAHDRQIWHDLDAINKHIDSEKDGQVRTSIIKEKINWLTDLANQDPQTYNHLLQQAEQELKQAEDSEAYESLSSKKNLARNQQAERKIQELPGDLFASDKTENLRRLANEYGDWLAERHQQLNEDLLRIQTETMAAAKMFGRARAQNNEANQRAAEQKLNQLTAEELTVQKQLDKISLANSLEVTQSSDLPSLVRAQQNEHQSLFPSAGAELSFRRREREFNEPIKASAPWEIFQASQKELNAVAARLCQIPNAGNFSIEAAKDLVSRPINTLSVDEAHSLLMAVRELRDLSRGKDKLRYGAMFDAVDSWIETNVKQRMAQVGKDLPETKRAASERAMDDADMMFINLSKGKFFDANGRHLPTELINTLRQLTKIRGEAPELVSKANARLKQVDNFLSAPAVRNENLAAVNAQINDPATQNHLELYDIRDRLISNIEKDRRIEATMNGSDQAASRAGAAIANEFIANENQPRQVAAQDFKKMDNTVPHVGRRPAVPKPFSKAKPETIKAITPEKNKPANKNESQPNVIIDMGSPAKKVETTTNNTSFETIAPLVSQLEQRYHEAIRMLKDGPASEHEYWQQEYGTVSNQLDDIEHDVVRTYEAELNNRLSTMSQAYGITTDQIRAASKNAESTRDLAEELIKKEDSSTTGFFAKISNALSRERRTQQLATRLSEINGLMVRSQDAKNRIADLEHYQQNLNK